jgi:hypothetical protein
MNVPLQFPYQWFTCSVRGYATVSRSSFPSFASVQSGCAAVVRAARRTVLHHGRIRVNPAKKFFMNVSRTTRQLTSENNGQLDWDRLREMCSDVSALRRGDHRAERLKLEQARLGRAKEIEN